MDRLAGRLIQAWIGGGEEVEDVEDAGKVEHEATEVGLAPHLGFR